MPEAMGMFTAMANKDKIYLGGGIISDSFNSRSIFEYCPMMNKYKSITTSLLPFYSTPVLILSSHDNVY